MSLLANNALKVESDFEIVLHTNFPFKFARKQTVVQQHF